MQLPPPSRLLRLRWSAICLISTALWLPPVAAQQAFIRGDTNQDAGIDLSDSIWTLSFLFAGGDMHCLDASDVNDDGAVDLSDAVYGLVFLFNDGNPPGAPFPDLGLDPTPDEIGCAECGSDPCPTDKAGGNFRLSLAPQGFPGPVVIDAAQLGKNFIDVHFKVTGLQTITDEVHVSFDYRLMVKGGTKTYALSTDPAWSNQPTPEWIQSSKGAGPWSYTQDSTNYGSPAGTTRLYVCNVPAGTYRLLVRSGVRLSNIHPNGGGSAPPPTSCLTAIKCLLEAGTAVIPITGFRPTSSPAPTFTT